VGGLLLRHEASQGHDTGAHPERIARIVAVERALAARDWLGCEVRDSPAVEDAALHAVHPAAYCAAIESACAAGGGALDPDTVVSAGSWEAARRGAGGAVALADALLGGEQEVGASLHRPPGHHAERARAMGFCLFNNVALAAQRALDEHGLERVLILDWDVHHGNGTNDIFHADPRVLFASIHEWPLYPGTGSSADTGSGAGEGYTINLPVPGGSGDEVFCGLVDHVVVPAGRAFEPQLVLVSAGFDAHAGDPLAGCEVTDEGFAAMASSMRRLAGEAGAPLGIVLEGGYDLDGLSSGLLATLEAATGAPGPGPDPAPAHPLAAEAAERVARRTPLAGR
jgi:acetoin utilization deacetylase AcuC-like enzyme